MKVYLNSAGESWVVDRFRDEWYRDNKKVSTNLVYFSDTIWILAPWVWNKIPKSQLKKKKVICSIYHIDFDKFGDIEKKDFKDRDKFVHKYHVISNNTMAQLEKLTSKKIESIPFWVNKNNWFEIEDKDYLRKKYNLPIDSFIVGSFQRDSEGKDLSKPKLSKGPDRFLEIVKKYNKEKNNLLVLLLGKRRDYLINSLKNENISFKYLEMVNSLEINELYNCLDLYIIASRVEGGPQAVAECAITKTPVISTNVGVAPEILSNESIFNMENYDNAKPNIDVAYKNVQKLITPNGYAPYLELIK